MSTLNFLDANVWLALIWERHIHSEVARQWFDREGDASFLFCRFTQLTALRLLTTASVMGTDVQTMKGAWDIWDRIASDERIKVPVRTGRSGCAVSEALQVDSGLAQGMGRCLLARIRAGGWIKAGHIGQGLGAAWL